MSTIITVSIYSGLKIWICQNDRQVGLARFVDKSRFSDACPSSEFACVTNDCSPNVSPPTVWMVARGKDTNRVRCYFLCVCISNLGLNGFREFYTGHECRIILPRLAIVFWHVCPFGADESTGFSGMVSSTGGVFHWLWHDCHQCRDLVVSSPIA